MTGFISVRTSSSRLNNKCLLKFGAFSTLLEYIINRSLCYGIDPIVCTSYDSSDDIIEEIANKKKVKIFRGNLDNKINRWSECANHFNLKNFHTIDADDPFFDGERMKNSIDLLNKGAYDYIKPSHYSDNGGASEGYSISTDFINMVAEKFNKRDLDTEMAIFYFDKFDNAKKTILKDPSYSLKVNGKIPRLTLDYFEDYVFLNFLELITKDSLYRPSIESFISNNNEIVDINIHLNEVWKNNQLKKKIK